MCLTPNSVLLRVILTFELSLKVGQQKGQHAHPGAQLWLLSAGSIQKEREASTFQVHCKTSTQALNSLNFAVSELISSRGVFFEFVERHKAHGNIRLN